MTPIDTENMTHPSAARHAIHRKHAQIRTRASIPHNARRCEYSARIVMSDKGGRKEVSGVANRLSERLLSRKEGES